MHNDIILKLSQSGFYGTRNEYGKVCIGEKSLKNDTPKNIKPTSKRNTITCGCETCISAILLQSDLNNGS